MSSGGSRRSNPLRLQQRCVRPQRRGGKPVYQVETGATKWTAGFPFTKTFVDGEKTPVYGELPVDDNRVPFHPRRLDTPDLINPPGEWNTYDVRVEGATIELRTNGEFNGVFAHVAVGRGHVGLEAEGYPISFRNIRVKPLR